ncbi:agglutinin [Helianthus annuus]|nr:agglutinin [Helianthus annuus]
MPQPFTNKIKIRVRHGSAINSIELQSYCTEGEGQISIFGGQAGTLTDTICVDGTNEYLMSISGTRSCLFGTKTVVVDSICFMTNLNLYGPYGVSYGATFSHDVKDRVVVGFHGRASDYLNANWIYVMPKSLELDSNSKSKGKIMSELCSSMSRMVMPRDVGPRGAGGGQSWDDGVFSTIKQVRVHVGELNVIYALQFEYQKRDGTSVLSQIHGGTNGLEIKMVNMDDKDEFIIGVSGFYGLVEGYKGLKAIVSISFHTNKRIHGPYGEELGARCFCSTPSPGKVVGFHGRKNAFLNAIGVHMENF